jgi:hypothetical protein
MEDRTHAWEPVLYITRGHLHWGIGRYIEEEKGSDSPRNQDAAHPVSCFTSIISGGIDRRKDMAPHFFYREIGRISFQEMKYTNATFFPDEKYEKDMLSAKPPSCPSSRQEWGISKWKRGSCYITMKSLEPRQSLA